MMDARARTRVSPLAARPGRTSHPSPSPPRHPSPARHPLAEQREAAACTITQALRRNSAARPGVDGRAPKHAHFSSPSEIAQRRREKERALLVPPAPRL